MSSASSPGGRRPSRPLTGRPVRSDVAAVRAPVLILCVVALCCVGCPKKQEDPPPPPEALAPDKTCAAFGRTLRSLAFRSAARTISATVPPPCHPTWGAQLDELAQQFWVKIDCGAEDTRALYTLYLATPESVRADPEQFPEAGSTPPESQTLRAFHAEAEATVAATRDDILRMIDAKLDGGRCARAAK